MPLVDVARVQAQKYDYIIVGGGVHSSKLRLSFDQATGLLLASRLSRDPSIFVLVLEAGKPNFDDPKIMLPGQMYAQFGDPDYDWAFTTTVQEHAGDTRKPWMRGKSLGGSTAMNMMSWIVPPKGDIDDWEKLGNDGWNWDIFNRHLQNVASFTVDPPTSEAWKYDSGTMKIWDRNWGKGEVQLIHSRKVLPTQVTIHETFKAAGIPIAKDPNGGNPSGCFFGLSTVDPGTNERSYAAVGFYRLYENRPNYHVLTDAHVRKILLSGDEPNIVATGARFGHTGNVYEVTASKEVILCAGALKSPQILELSGIGNPKILSSHGIPVRVGLEGVGENVQEHVMLGVTNELREDAPGQTFDILRDPAAAAEQMRLLLEEKKGLFTVNVNNLAFLPLSTVSARADKLIADERAKINAGAYPPEFADQYDFMLQRIEQGGCGFEVIGFPGTFPSFFFTLSPEPGKRHLTLCAANNYLFSRGSIHIMSADPTQDPTFNPRYLEHDIDAQILVDMVKFLRKVFARAPLADLVSREVNPGQKFQTDEELLAWVKKETQSVFHTVGSLAMLPRSKNGVVDTSLRVYGTKNLRVADISIVPLHFSGQSLSTAYTIAEVASRIILASGEE
ncbi:GMC oxidoreductase [Cylindrobasidium torrendii FP15055 ss-10]|uniref:GMC oxidoreductase n=1 Tax=Cylindrobasidium torrendii FP15055 ss-10 TaxID=1314674 RepID=A0A0D7BA90_9AGAR|nr:GMC oxidoreductase [Cylindrobasidium torrendii FP15055 ss-10]